MKKDFCKGFISALLLTGMICTAAATTGRQSVEISYNNIDVTLDGAAVQLVDANGNPVEPFVIDGTTYLPVRAVANALGLNVGWNQETTTVTLDTPEARKPIYITQSGKKYHDEPNCNGGHYYEVPLQTAINMGLEPCSKCIGDNIVSSAVTEKPADPDFQVINNNDPFLVAPN